MAGEAEAEAEAVERWRRREEGRRAAAKDLIFGGWDFGGASIVSGQIRV